MYQNPSELQKLRELMSEDGLVILAGGTDLVPLIKNGVKQPKSFLNIKEIPELNRIEKKGFHWLIGAGVTLTDIAAHEALASDLPALHQAAAATASLQIRNVGTIGGNIMQDRRCIYYNQSAIWRSSIPRCFKTGGSHCHQIPNSQDCRALYYSDLSVALCAYNAKALIWEGGQEKNIPVEELVKAHAHRNGTVKPEGILVETFLIETPVSSVKSAFEKISVRNSIDFPVVHFAGCYDTHTLMSRLFAGAISDVPVELTETEQILLSGITDLDTLTLGAVDEMKKKSRLVKEAGLSPKVKRDTFLNVRLLLEKLLVN